MSELVKSGVLIVLILIIFSSFVYAVNTVASTAGVNTNTVGVGIGTPVCSPGSVNITTNSSCQSGYMRSVCGSLGQWSSWICTECAPGQTRNVADSSCSTGFRSQTCSSYGQWTSGSCVTGCVSGTRSITDTSCQSGLRTQTCTNNAWVNGGCTTPTTTTSTITAETNLIVNIPGTDLTYNKGSCNLTAVWHNETDKLNYRTGGSTKVIAYFNNPVRSICCCIKSTNGLILPNGAPAEVAFYDSDIFSGPDYIGKINGSVVDGCVVVENSFNDTYDSGLEGPYEGELYFTVSISKTVVCYSGEGTNQLLYIRPPGGCVSNSECTSPQICYNGYCRNMCTGVTCNQAQVCNQNTGNCVAKPCTTSTDCGNTTLFKCNIGSCVSCNNVTINGISYPDCNDDGIPYNGNCLNDSACARGNICENWNCTPGCRNDAGCSSGEYCFSKICVPRTCTRDSDCGDVNKFRCVKSTYTALCQSCSGSGCTNCTTDLNCAPTEKCTSGSCVVNGTKCTINSQCPAGKICRTSVGDCISAPSCTSNADCPATAHNCCNSVCSVSECPIALTNGTSGGGPGEGLPGGGSRITCSSVGGIICQNGNCGPNSELASILYPSIESSDCCIATDLTKPPTCMSLTYSPSLGTNVAHVSGCKNIDQDPEEEFIQATCLSAHAQDLDTCINNAIVPNPGDPPFEVLSELCHVPPVQANIPWFGTGALVLAFVLLILFYVLRSHKKRSRKVLKKRH